MSDILSQDQIDALLNSQGFDSGGGGDAGDPSDVYAMLLTTFDLFCEQAGTVISTVLNKSITYKTELCEPGEISTIQEKLPAVPLLLKLTFKSGLDGELYLIIQKKDAAILSDLMMMGDGSAEYAEDHKDAIGELFNQVMGAFTTALSSSWGTSISAGSVEVSELDLDHAPFQIDSFEMILVSQNLEGMEESYVVLLIAKDMTKLIAENTKSTPGAGNGSLSDSIDLNMSELDDLSKVTSFDSDNSSVFKEQYLSTGSKTNAPQQNIDMLLDIDLDVNIELGSSHLSIKRILELAPGSIVELDRMAGEPVDLLVNNKVVAKGEVVVIDENFGIRIVSLVSPEERIRSLR